MPAAKVVIAVQDRLYAETLADSLAQNGFGSCVVVDRRRLSRKVPGGREDGSHTIVLLEGEGDRSRNGKVISVFLNLYPAGKVIVLVDGQESSGDGAALLRMGAHGVFSKENGLRSLLSAIKAVSRGGVRASRRSAVTPVTALSVPGSTRRGRRRHDGDLSKREKQILALVAGGLKNGQIGERLHISERTVKVHLNRIFKKIEARDRLQAALYAIHNGITPSSVSLGD